MNHIRTFLLLLSLVTLAVPALANAKPTVFVSVEPQRYVVQKLVGDAVNVSVMVRTGASPATYEPSPKQLAALSGAAAYLAIGVPFEAAWLPRIRGASEAMTVANVDAGIKKKAMAAHEHHEEPSHGSHHEEVGHHEEHGDHDAHHDDHNDGILDPHVWVSPALMKIIARNTADALGKVLPAETATIQSNLQAFLAEIDQLDRDIRDTLHNVPEARRTFLVFHPSWGYFADDYHLTQVPIEAEGKEPGPKALMRIIHEGREMNAKVVFVQPQFSDKSARVIASELDARVLPLDPLAEDWADNLRRAANTFRETLQ